MHQAEISLYPYCRLPIIIEITTIEYIFDISILVVESYYFGPNIFWPSDPKIAAKYYVKSSWKWILLQQRSVARDFVHYSNRWAAVRAPKYLLHFQRFRLDDLDFCNFHLLGIHKDMLPFLELFNSRGTHNFEYFLFQFKF